MYHNGETDRQRELFFVTIVRVTSWLDYIYALIAVSTIFVLLLYTVGNTVGTHQKFFDLVLHNATGIVSKHDQCIYTFTNNTLLTCNKYVLGSNDTCTVCINHVTGVCDDFTTMHSSRHFVSTFPMLAKLISDEFCGNFIGIVVTVVVILAAAEHCIVSRKIRDHAYIPIHQQVVNFNGNNEL